MQNPNRAHKHSRPSEPVTPEILKVILIKTSQLQETFRDFNEDDRNDRRSDIIAKFIAECDRVHGKFRENDKWSYKDFIEYNLDWVARRYRRDAGRAIENRPPEMVSLDAPVESEDGEATFHDFVADRRDRHDSAILKSDYKEILSILRRRNPRYAAILEMTVDGFTQQEIADALGVPKWEVKTSLWPEAKAEARRIYKFINYRSR